MLEDETSRPKIPLTCSTYDELLPPTTRVDETRQTGRDRSRRALNAKSPHSTKASFVPQQMASRSRSAPTSRLACLEDTSLPVSPDPHSRVPWRMVTQTTAIDTAEPSP